ncbi:MAG TPA: LysR family transcriptional regulator [Clostridiales bacterium]|nr:LysR family transcriptional regulator [Clostridiales bacterium]
MKSDMDKIDWMLLKILHKEKSMVRASEQLFISQPAISYRLKRMEDQFGQELFVRSNKGVTLTSAGMRLYSFANLMIQYEDEIYSAVNRSDSVLSGTIKIGTTETFFESHLSGQLKEFHERYPNIQVFVRMSPTPELLKLVAAGELMMCTIRGKRPENGNTIQIFDEPLLVISSEPISEEMMRTKPLVRNMPGSPAVYYVDEWLSTHFSEPPPMSPITIAGSSRSIVSLVKTGIGWGVIPASRYYADSDRLYCRPIYRLDGSLYSYQTYLYYTNEATHFDTYMAYISHVQQYFLEHYTDTFDYLNSNNQ